MDIAQVPARASKMADRGYYNNHLAIHYNFRYYIRTKVWTRMHANSAPTAYAGVDHEGSLCSCCLDCLEDVHSSFNFDSLNFSHTSDEHTTAGHTITEKMGRMNMHWRVEQM